MGAERDEEPVGLVCDPGLVGTVVPVIPWWPYSKISGAYPGTVDP